MSDAQEKQNEGKGRSKKIKGNKRKQKKVKESQLFFGIKPFQWIRGESANVCASAA
jgi:hypothetical protein